MLTLNFYKTMAATILILAVSCSPLLAKDRKSGRSKAEKTKASAPAVASSRPAPRRQKTVRTKSVRKQQQNTKRTRPKTTVPASNKRPSRVTAGTRPSRRSQSKTASAKQHRASRPAEKSSHAAIGTRTSRPSRSKRHHGRGWKNRPAKTTYPLIKRTVEVVNLSRKKRKAPDVTIVNKTPTRVVVKKPPRHSSVQLSLGTTAKKPRNHHRSAVKQRPRYEHIYRDRRNRLSHRIIWPKYRYMVHYNWGPAFTFRYVYPYHHRKYVFISLGGYWPIHYRYLRYYWYGYHPYRWYGRSPIARQAETDTHNYYTYNYYNTQNLDTAPAAYDAGYVDHTTFADVREKLAQQAAQEPAEQTPADMRFDEAVTAFEAGDYAIASDKFAKAAKLAPDDMILPFASAQALFADEQYSEAAEVLRSALANVTPEEEGVFYPRGLYSEDEVLFEQIDRLTERTGFLSHDADLQLLSGYQLLGIGKIDEAAEHLQQAQLDMDNTTAATVLLGLVEKIKTENPENTDL